MKFSPCFEGMFFFPSSCNSVCAAGPRRPMSNVRESEVVKIKKKKKTKPFFVFLRSGLVVEPAVTSGRCLQRPNRGPAQSSSPSLQKDRHVQIRQSAFHSIPRFLLGFFWASRGPPFSQPGGSPDVVRSRLRPLICCRITNWPTSLVENFCPFENQRRHQTHCSGPVRPNQDSSSIFFSLFFFPIFFFSDLGRQPFPAFFRPPSRLQCQPAPRS